MHPLVDNLQGLKEAEIEAKINDLTRKYFMSRNPDVQLQIASVLETYKEELNTRRQAEWQKMTENRDKNLDKLIKVD